MRTLALFLLMLWSILLAIGQDLSGVTGIRDTSFTPEREYMRMLKAFPDIQLVQEEIGGSRASRDVPYLEVDNSVLTADIYHSVSEGRCPGIVIIHGGGWRSGDKRQLGPLAQRLAAKGFTCITINYRLSTEALYPAAICDVKAAIQWLRENADSLYVDPDKIAALGFSAGGHLAALAGTTASNVSKFADVCEGDRRNNHVQAIVDIDGILAFIHPESGEGDDRKSKSAATHWFGYTKEQREDLWVEASPLTHVSAATPPTLFINSSVNRMHAGRDDFIKELDQLGIYHDTKVFPDAPHSFCLFEPWFTPTLGYIVDFLAVVFR